MKANFALIFVLICLVLTTACGSIFGVKDSLKVVLDDPPDNIKLTEGDITFRWHPENTKKGVEYNYTVLFDKGTNPFDHHIETYAKVGEATEYTRKMSADWWWRVEWGIRVEVSGQIW